MPYNIYLPEGYDKNKKKVYPLVVFIADASANIEDAKAVLYQGNGATVLSYARRTNRSIQLLFWHRNIRRNLFVLLV